MGTLLLKFFFVLPSKISPLKNPKILKLFLHHSSLKLHPLLPKLSTLLSNKTGP